MITQFTRAKESLNLTSWQVIKRMSLILKFNLLRLKQEDELRIDYPPNIGMILCLHSLGTLRFVIFFFFCFVSLQINKQKDQFIYQE